MFHVEHFLKFEPFFCCTEATMFHVEHFLLTALGGLMYETLKIIHIISVISWMCGLLYMPRLFVYHHYVTPRSKEDLLFQTMERRLMKIIMNPAMIIAFITGLTIFVTLYEFGTNHWFDAKLLLAILLAGFHGYLSTIMKKFRSGTYPKNAKFFRIINEVPTILMILIVILVVAKPF
jgi:protoporphyrinogen IX oxidase